MVSTSESQKSELKRVWEPLQIGGVKIRNRIVQPAHSSQHGDARDHIFSERQIAYFAERAKGGVGLAVTETVAAARSAMGSFYNIVNVFDERCIPSMEKLGAGVHEHGGRLFVQLSSMGVHDRGRMFIDHTRPIWGASRIPSLVHNEIPLVMGPDELTELAQDFAVSADNVRRAGLDGVELHGAHSYGLGQFLSPTYNRRDDRYGGSPAKRCQLMIDCAERVRERIGNDLVVGVRLSWDEFLGEEGGITPAQSEEQLAVLADTGLFDYFSISAGGYQTLHTVLPGMEHEAEEGWLAPYSKKAREILAGRAPVIVVGKVRDLHTAEAILADDAADMVAMGRQLLTDAHTVNKTAAGREHEIIRCNRCNECGARLFEHRELLCALNPVSGRESYWGEGTLTTAKPVKKIAVIGGGPAGMKAAAVAARRGHKVTLFEAKGELGGHLRLYERLPHMSGWGIAIDNLERELEHTGVEALLEHEATVAELLQIAPDFVAVATGAHYEKSGLSMYRPERGQIPGAERDHVYDIGTAAALALADPHALGQSVLIVDESGAHLPFALAQILGTAGVDVEVLSPRMFAGERIYRNLDIAYIFPRLKESGVRVTHQHFVQEIGEQDVKVYDIWAGPERYETRTVDSVVLSILREPNDSLYHEIRARGLASVRLGDVAAPRDITAALHDAEAWGRDI